MRVHRTGSLVRVTEEAPPGMVWVAGGVHELVAESRGPGATASAKQDVKERMGYGLRRCDDPACDWCNE